MVTDKIINPYIRHICKDKLISSQHGGRENRGVNTAKIELLLGAKEKGYNKALLIDIKRAFDTINRDELRTQIDIFSQDNPILKALLNNIIDIYDNINYEICEHIIEPKRGIPQGSVFGPLLFIIYINETLKDLKNSLPNIISEAFIDDIIIMPNDIDQLKKGIRNPQSKIKKTSNEPQP